MAYVKTTGAASLIGRITTPEVGRSALDFPRCHISKTLGGFPVSKVYNKSPSEVKEEVIDGCKSWLVRTAFYPLDERFEDSLDLVLVRGTRGSFRPNVV